MAKQRPESIANVPSRAGWGARGTPLGRRIGTILPVFAALALLGLLFYYPLGGLVARGISGEGEIRIGPILRIFASPYLRRVILFTVEQALLSTLLSVVIGFPLAYLLAAYEFPGRRILKSLTAVPFALPAITVALGFVIVFGNNGVLNRVLKHLLGQTATPLPILYSLQGILLANAFYNAPIVARFVGSAWESLPRTYEESARSMGIGKTRVFRDITLPMLAPSLVSGAMLAFIYSFLSFPIVLILGGARFTTVEVEIYRRAIVETNYAGAAVLATLELVLALLFTFMYLKIEARYARRTRPSAPRRGRPLFGRKGRRHGMDWRRWTVYLLVALYLLFYLGPIAGILADSLTRAGGGGAGLTVNWYRQVFQPRYSSIIAASPLQSIKNSVFFALSSMVLSLLVGALLAAVLTIRRLPGRSVIETLVMAPLGTSPVALGFAYLWIFTRAPLRISGTAEAIIIVHSILAVPFVVRSLRPALARIEARFGEAARSLGASVYRSAVDIVLPLSRNALTTAAVFAFAVSFAETSATIMLTRPRLLTMPVAVYYLLSGREFGAAAAMGVLLIVVISLSFVLIERFGERAVGGLDGRLRY